MPTQATADQWQAVIDPSKKWLKIVVESGQVTSVSCLLCAKHHDKLQCVRNYSDSFVKGIEGSNLKRQHS